MPIRSLAMQFFLVFQDMEYLYSQIDFLTLNVKATDETC